MNIYNVFDLFDIGTLVLLFVCTLFSRKIYKRLPAQQVVFLYIGFLLMTVLQIGFIVISFMPIEGGYSLNRFIGELTVALRFIPVVFIMIGMIKLFKSVFKYIE